MTFYDFFLTQVNTFRIVLVPAARSLSGTSGRVCSADSEQRLLGAAAKMAGDHFEFAVVSSQHGCKMM